MSDVKTLEALTSILLDLKELEIPDQDARGLINLAIENIEEAQLFIEGLEYCSICGDFHEIGNAPINCKTGDGN